MLIIDERKAELARQLKSAEAAAEARKNWIEREDALSKYIDKDNSPFDDARRFGKIMMASDFEARLQKLNPNILFRFGLNLQITNSKWMMIRKGNKVENLLCYPFPVLPERSLWRRQEVVRPMQEYGRPHLPGGMAMNKLDYPSKKWVPVDQELANNLNAAADTNFSLAQMQAAWAPDGQGIGRWIYEDESKLPGMERKVLPFGELLRGWRTCALILVREGHLTPMQVEREFLADDTPEWRGNIGRGPKTRPF